MKIRIIQQPIAKFECACGQPVRICGDQKVICCGHVYSIDARLNTTTWDQVLSDHLEVRGMMQRTEQPGEREIVCDCCKREYMGEDVRNMFMRYLVCPDCFLHNCKPPAPCNRLPADLDVEAFMRP